MKQTIFVYGSLKSGFWNHSVLGASQLICEAVTEDSFLLTDVGFPYMVPENAHTEAVGHPTLPVMGEMYEVTSEDVMRSLDALEGRGHHYDQQEITVRSKETGELTKVMTYIPCDMDRAVQYRVCETDTFNNQECYVWN